MRLSLAAAILAQGLSSSSTSSLSDENGNNNNDGLLLLLSDESSHVRSIDLPSLRKKSSILRDRDDTTAGISFERFLRRNDDEEYPTNNIGTMIIGPPKTGAVTSRILQNLRDLQEIVECTPPPTSPEINGPEGLDVGILACGVGRYCAVSSESKLGGRCTDIQDEFSFRRSLQTSNGTIIEELLYVCENAEYAGYECTCDFTDYENYGNYTGTSNCTTLEPECATVINGCDVNVTICFDSAYSINVLGPGSKDVTYCLTYTTPLNQTTCTSSNVRDYANFESCDIDIDGIQCDSCAPIYSVTANSSRVCYEFDCTNTVGGQLGNTCDGVTPGSTVQSFVATYGCPPCLLCDPYNTGTGAEVTYPDNDIIFDGYNYTCKYIADAGMEGLIYGDNCVSISALAYDTCGCAVPGESNTTTAPSTVTDAPTATPTTLNVTDSDNICDPCDGGDLLNPNGTINIPDSDDEITCEELATAGGAGNIPSDLCPAVQMAAAGPCCTEAAVTEAPASVGPSEICNPCGEDRVMTILTGQVSIPTLGIFSCQELLDLGEAGNITGSLCVVARSFVQTPCGCRATVPTAAPSDSPPTVSPTAAATTLSMFVGSVIGVCVTLMAHIGFA